MPRGSGRVSKNKGRKMPKISRTNPKRVTTTKNTQRNPRFGLKDLRRMGRSLIRSGYRLARKQKLSMNSRVLDMAIAPTEHPDSDVTMEDAPMAQTISSLSQIADEYDWNIVEEELSYLMAALRVASRTEEAPEPQFIEVERRPPPICRLPTTPAQEKEIKRQLAQIKRSRDVLRQRECRERRKVAHVASLIEQNFQLLNQNGVSNAELYGDDKKHVEHAEDRELEQPQYIANSDKLEDVGQSEHVEHVEDVKSCGNPEIIYSCKYKRRDPTANITPKKIPLDTQCPVPAIWTDHLLAAHVPLRKKCKRNAPLLKTIMTKKVTDKLWSSTGKIEQYRHHLCPV